MVTLATAARRDGERLLFIKQHIAAVLPGVTSATLEGYSYGSTGRVFELGELGGVTKVLLTEQNIPYHAVPPLSVKKFATGNAHADKAAMVAAAVQQGAPCTDDNQADAFFLALIAYTLAQPPPLTQLPRFRLEVIHALRRPPPRKKNRSRPRRLIPNAI